MHYGFVIVFCCCLMMGINVGIAFSCAGIFYKPVSASLGVSIGTFGIYQAFICVASTLMLSVAGRMLERLSARWIFTASSGLMGACYVAMSFFSNVWEFYVAGAVIGITMAFLLYLSFPTMINRWFRSRIGFFMGVCTAASGIGGIVLNPIAGWIITNYGWQMAYGALGGFVLIVVTPLLGLLLRDYPEQKGILAYGASEKESVVNKNHEEEGILYAKAVRMPVFYGLVVFAFLIMANSSLNLFIPNYAIDLRFTLEQASFAASSAMAGVTVGKLLLGYINDRNCSAGVLTTTLGGIAGLCMLLAGNLGLWIIMAGAFFFGWAYAGVTVQTAMLTRTIFGNRNYSRIYSMISVATAAGGALSTGGWGLLVDVTSYRFIFSIGTGMLAVCCMIGLWALNGKGRK